MNKAINFNFELRPFFSDRQLNCTRGQAFKASHCVENLHFVTMKYFLWKFDPVGVIFFRYLERHLVKGT